MVRLIAHRGFADVHPENTLAAVRRSATVADAVEIDVRRCGSGELAVVHDETVDRTTDGTGAVADHARSELRELDVLGSGEGVPTLAAVLDAVPDDVALNVELKEPETAADALELVADADVPVFVSSFHPDALAAARDAAPDVPRAYLFRDDPASGLATARGLDCEYVHPHHDLCTEEFVMRAREEGFGVNAWTVRDRETARRLRNVRVDGLIADAPAVACQ